MEFHFEKNNCQSYHKFFIFVSYFVKFEELVFRRNELEANIKSIIRIEFI